VSRSLFRALLFSPEVWLLPGLQSVDLSFDRLVSLIADGTAGPSSARTRSKGKRAAAPFKTSGRKGATREVAAHQMQVARELEERAAAITQSIARLSASPTYTQFEVEEALETLSELLREGANLDSTALASEHREEIRSRWEARVAAADTLRVFLETRLRGLRRSGGSGGDPRVSQGEETGGPTGGGESRTPPREGGIHDGVRALPGSASLEVH
jgi:uncharacterized coiled-coil protein SlyX